MYAIAFELILADRQENFGAPSEAAYEEIRHALEAAGFRQTHGCLYLSSEKANLATVYLAIDRLRQIAWFKRSVRDLYAFKVENWSDFTPIVRA